jgi:hypothetical protein
VTGAAAAKLFISLFDTAVLFVLARRLGAPAPLPLARLRRRAGAAAAAAILVLLTGFAMVAPLAVRVSTAIVVILVFSAAVWKHALEPGDRAAVLGLITRVRLKEAV